MRASGGFEVKDGCGERERVVACAGPGLPLDQMHDNATWSGWADGRRGSRSRQGIFAELTLTADGDYKPVPVTEINPAKNKAKIAKRIENSVMAFRASKSRISNWNQIGLRGDFPAAQVGRQAIFSRQNRVKVGPLVLLTISERLDRVSHPSGGRFGSSEMPQAAPSSRGLGHRLFMPATRVRLP